MIDLNTENKFKTLNWSIIILGFILRIRDYYANNSLWGDEVRIALNIIDKPFTELIKPLDYYQNAPLGFLYIEKLIAHCFGNSEYALRLFPLIASLISIILFYKLAKYILDPSSVSIALLLFSILTSLVYYSAEVKQYSSDVLAALAIFLIAIVVDKHPPQLKNYVFIGILGATLIWISYPVIFILISTWTVLLVCNSQAKELDKVRMLLISGVLWAASFVANYFLITHSVLENTGSVNYWIHHFMPLVPFPVVPIQWLLRIHKELCDFLPLPNMAIFIIIFGLIITFKNNKKLISLLVLPIIVTLFASVMHKYPIWQRFILFSIPLIVLLLVNGLEGIKKITYGVPFIWMITLIAVFNYPIQSAINNFKNPRTFEEMRPALHYVKNHLYYRDVIYLSSYLQYSFKYYGQSQEYIDIKVDRSSSEVEKNRNYITDKYSLIIGTYFTPSRENYIQDLKLLRGNKRVWIILHGLPEDLPHFNAIRYLNTIGTRLNSFRAPGILVYLYDLS